MKAAHLIINKASKLLNNIFNSLVLKSFKNCSNIKNNIESIPYTPLSFLLLVMEWETKSLKMPARVKKQLQRINTLPNNTTPGLGKFIKN